MALHSITLHYSIVHYTTLHCTHDTTLHHATLTTTATTTTLLYTTRHYTALRYTAVQFLHHKLNRNYTKLITLHHSYGSTTLQLQLQLRYATPHYVQQLWVRWPTSARWPLQPLQPLKNTQLQPPFGPSMDSLCHPWFTATSLSRGFLSLKLSPSPCAVLLISISIY